MGIVIKRENIKKELKEDREENKRIVFTNGCFDLMHIGHLRYLQKAKSFGDILIIGVNSDNSVKRLKGETRPIVSEEDRAEMLAGLEAVDYVVLFDEDTPVEILEEIKPNVHVKGGDYKKEDLPETKIIEENGGEVKIVTFVDGKSTSNIIEKIKSI